jgi:hypothetical protein
MLFAMKKFLPGIGATIASFPAFVTGAASIVDVIGNRMIRNAYPLLLILIVGVALVAGGVLAVWMRPTRPWYLASIGCSVLLFVFAVLVGCI